MFKIISIFICNKINYFMFFIYFICNICNFFMIGRLGFLLIGGNFGGKFDYF